MTDPYKLPFRWGKLLPTTSNRPQKLVPAHLLREDDFFGENGNRQQKFVPAHPLRNGAGEQSGFGNAQRFGNHRAATDDVQQNERMKDERTNENFATWKCSADAAHR